MRSLPSRRKQDERPSLAGCDSATRREERWTRRAGWKHLVRAAGASETMAWAIPVQKQGTLGDRWAWENEA